LGLKVFVVVVVVVVCLFWFLKEIRSYVFITGGVYRDILPTQDIFSKALYTFDIGQNDLTSGYFSNMTTKEVKGYLPDLMDRFTNLVKVRKPNQNNDLNNFIILVFALISQGIYLGLC
jgi:hypothetical protein